MVLSWEPALESGTHHEPIIIHGDILFHQPIFDRDNISFPHTGYIALHVIVMSNSPTSVVESILDQQLRNACPGIQLSRAAFGYTSLVIDSTNRWLCPSCSVRLDPSKRAYGHAMIEQFGYKPFNGSDDFIALVEANDLDHYLREDWYPFSYIGDSVAYFANPPFSVFCNNRTGPDGVCQFDRRNYDWEPEITVRFHLEPGQWIASWKRIRQLLRHLTTKMEPWPCPGCSFNVYELAYHPELKDDKVTQEHVLRSGRLFKPLALWQDDVPENLRYCYMNKFEDCFSGEGRVKCGQCDWLWGTGVELAYDSTRVSVMRPGKFNGMERYWSY
ncbi:hypothetical protein BDV95DRAFT_330954 [Massariosphaeria phaeospora]|uniref:Uncharacterized protein n=1 Tax=Massariosphaeria phaeospora TaxID=100035 RepID=A0A7C8MIR5_9PLEO|nr:hypothetical protein BDV95DRAFT_330954 [Massariosphaeria phaeospora]